MITFEEAGAVLDEAVDALPKEIFENLNGGVNLLPAVQTDDNGLLVMGRYFSDQMGRHVEIYYGSFCRAHPHSSPEKCRRALVATLKHELTHHIENQAYDRTLEKWDEQHEQELLAGLCDEPLDADSVLFVCGDNAALSPMAEAIFRLAAADGCPGVECASAGLQDPPPERTEPRAVKAAAIYGADISLYRPRAVTSELMERFDAVLCMTGTQCDELAERFPSCDPKIMCLGEEDITPPLLGFSPGWSHAASKVAREVDYLVSELSEKEGGGDDGT